MIESCTLRKAIVIVCCLGALHFGTSSQMLDVDGVFKSCDFVCSHGACIYDKCEFSKCPGGGCTFLNSKDSTCSGGACTFNNCFRSTCDGGSCSFLSPPETLQQGYCDGENCDVDGNPHPVLAGFLSI